MLEYKVIKRPEKRKIKPQDPCFQFDNNEKERIYYLLYHVNVRLPRGKARHLNGIFLQIPLLPKIN
jgi:hypothetical protein